MAAVVGTRCRTSRWLGHGDRPERPSVSSVTFALRGRLATPSGTASPRSFERVVLFLYEACIQQVDKTLLRSGVSVLRGLPGQGMHSPG